MAQHKYRITKKGKIVIIVVLLGIASLSFYAIRFSLNTKDSMDYDINEYKKTLSEWDQNHLSEEALIEIIGIMKEWEKADKEGSIVKRLETHLKAENLRTNFRNKDEIGTSDGGTITIQDDQLKELYYKEVNLIVDIVSNKYKYSDEQIEKMYNEYQNLVEELNDKIKEINT